MESKLHTLKPVHIVGAVLILAALLLGATAFAGSLTPYVTIAQARTSGRSVQVHGYLQQIIGYDEQGYYRFVIADDQGDELLIMYERPRQANLEQASGFVVHGRYDAELDAFRATRVLLKCPSKYQEADQEQAQAPEGRP
ncbi:MAG: cytochrome c maturation protein CcmE [Chloroflexia bacterium]|nr:cytochrome c maturation protein CcmE [Chloroflexia bacterium]